MTGDFADIDVVALAPTNTLPGNPAALEKAFDTGDEIDAPVCLGNTRFPGSGPAPGTYIHTKLAGHAQ